MKEQYPKRYNPGELEVTRKRLGELSADEARRYVELLGGEVGIEREAGAGDSVMPADLQDSPRFVSGSASRKKYGKVSYFQQIKIDFLCASDEHGIKSRGNLFFTLFRFIFPNRDFIKPAFFKNCNESFLKALENLVQSVRGIRAAVWYSRVESHIPELHKAIINEIARWHIEGIGWELVRLQSHPRKRRFFQLRQIVRSLYLPMLRLNEIRDQYLFLKALRSYYTALLKQGPLSGNRKRIKTYYEVAKAELPIVFERIKRVCYPLLLKICGTRFYSYENFFKDGFLEAVVCMGVKDGEMIREEDFSKTDSPKDEKINEEADPTDSEIEIDEVAAAITGRYGESGIFSDGNKLLTAMFPGIGWKSPSEHTDLYISLGLVLSYPKGSGLIAPDDPLMTVLTLVLLVQELITGFRAVDFGIVRDEDENVINVTEELKESTKDWYRYVEEIAGTLYLPMLTEYCRQIERDVRFRGTIYGRKALSELNWIKKHVFFPFLSFHAEQGSRVPAKVSADSPLPPLSETVGRQYTILHSIAADYAENPGDVTDSMKNPGQPFYFEVETAVSRRLRKILGDNELPLDNVVLVHAVFLIVKLIDEYIGNPVSKAYDDETGTRRPFRNEEGFSGSPIYSVELLDPGLLFKET